MPAQIIGIGTALPEYIPTHRYIAHAKKFSCNSHSQEKILEELYRKTAIKSRCSVLAGKSYGQEADSVFVPPKDSADKGPTTSARMEYYIAEVAPLARMACEQALNSSTLSSREITHLITVSCTGFHAPGFDISLINNLGLNPYTARTHVGFMGCHGTMNALRVAKAFVESNAEAKVLICSAELCSLHFQYGWSTDTLVANSLFADGAAALVVTAATARGTNHLQVSSSISQLLPDSLDMMTWKIGDHGFFMHLSSKVPDMVQTYLPAFMQEWLSKQQLRISDIKGWAVHAGGPRILDAVKHSLNLADDQLRQSRTVLSMQGNMSSPTVVFVLDQLIAEKIPGPYAMLGFGPGLTIEAALLL